MTPRTIFFIFLVISSAFGGVLSEVQSGPSESECRPYIEKALQGAGTPESQEELEQTPISEAPPVESQDGLEIPEEPGDSLENAGETGGGSAEEATEEVENAAVEESQAEQASLEEEGGASVEGEVSSVEVEAADASPSEEIDAGKEEESKPEETEETQSAEGGELEKRETNPEVEGESLDVEAESTQEQSAEAESQNVGAESLEEEEKSKEATQEISSEVEQAETNENSEETPVPESTEENVVSEAPQESQEAPQESQEAPQESQEAPQESQEAPQESQESPQESQEAPQESQESPQESQEAPQESQEAPQEQAEEQEKAEETISEEKTDAALETTEQITPEAVAEESVPQQASQEEAATEPAEAPSAESPLETSAIAPESQENNETQAEIASEGEKSPESESPEEELTMEIEIPKNLRSRDHMGQILQLDIETAETEKILAKVADSTLRDLKKLYDAAIKPLEILYKYRDLSNRHFGDPEIFSKPLILFMGPWSGGKSTIINYLLENEYKRTALRTGAEPSPAYFNIVMWGEQEEVLDGTQLAADWTFSGLQKFGQGLLDRLRGLKLNHPLLEKVNIVEIPGILEIRKQVERLFPFNDACQWFIDRADIIFLVYDPSKLDVGPESEAILDQLKGREMQTRIILNKADQVRPEELMRVQGTLIWNISPLMSSTEPPVMYSTSLWSLPYESGAPTRLLYAQEMAFLRDLREAINKRVENKISSARRFAVRVRNHAKMVDCYLTTYYNHKSFFGNKKKVSDDIIEHPQNYHIYEGLSTLTNISRYDLPDPDVYRDFFRLNPVYEFQQLSATCTYFRGCPINRLDIAIAYDLPELVGKYKKQVESINKGRQKAKNQWRGH